ncbi:hypothetical protein SDC9_161770 [bioreactor metagenome]|uniref:Uncharacterized protein n=1 Tax=bioreactor metagenome TaxID=1076179 RepID=A0A645FQH8_9ZZZZ
MRQSKQNVSLPGIVLTFPTLGKRRVGSNVEKGGVKRLSSSGKAL